MLRRQFTLSALAVSTLAFLGIRTPQYGWILDHPSRHKPDAKSDSTCLTYRTREDALMWLGERLAPLHSIRRVEFLDSPQWRTRRPVFNILERDGKPIAVPRPDFMMPPFVVATLADERHPWCPRVKMS